MLRRQHDCCSQKKLQTVLLLLVLLALPAAHAVAGNCTCDPEEKEEPSTDVDKRQALKYKLGAIASILIASAIGVCLPVLGKALPALSPERGAFFLIKAFAAGVILATGFIHALPDAFEQLTSPSLNKKPWKFPFTGFVAMLSAIGTLMVDSAATSYYQKVANSPVGYEERVAEQAGRGHAHIDVHASQGHAHGPVTSYSELLRHRVISQVLDLGIVVHSVIIGISLGTSQSPKKIRPLVAALTFHQFFEGMGLGGCISQAKFRAGSFAIMAIFFALTTPVGIGIGIVITKRY
ncbi:zinc transporter 1-like [Malania oleifera]|uniref:zinc transporter 1-like n=1 Tax=Malania oleifera TaxID=397392 RepID=UPI0025AD9F26|nr:zinc transporter 1-like [Malania oleifera]